MRTDELIMSGFLGRSASPKRTKLTVAAIRATMATTDMTNFRVWERWRSEANASSVSIGRSRHNVPRGYSGEDKTVKCLLLNKYYAWST